MSTQTDPIVPLDNYVGPDRVESWSLYPAQGATGNLLMGVHQRLREYVIDHWQVCSDAAQTGNALTVRLVAIPEGVTLANAVSNPVSNARVIASWTYANTAGVMTAVSLDAVARATRTIKRTERLAIIATQASSNAWTTTGLVSSMIGRTAK